MKNTGLGGVGYKLQDLSYTSGRTFTNTFGKPVVFMYGHQDTRGRLDLYINGVHRGVQGFWDNGGVNCPMTIILPPNNYVRITGQVEHVSILR